MLYDQRLHAAFERLDQFFLCVAALPQEQMQQLAGLSRSSSMKRLTFDLHPDRLRAVSEGRWTRGHDLLAAEAQRRARAISRHLAPMSKRGALARVLENAALVSITDSHPDTVLPAELRACLLGPWAQVTSASLDGNRLTLA